MSVSKGSKGRGKAKFFGFPLSNVGAQIVFILGVLLLIGTLMSFLFLTWSFISTSALLSYYGTHISYAGAFLSWIPWLITEIFMLGLAIYMIKVGKQGR